MPEKPRLTAEQRLANKRESRRRSYENNREKALAAQRAYYAANRERLTAQMRENAWKYAKKGARAAVARYQALSEADKERERARQRARYAKNRERICARRRARYEQDPAIRQKERDRNMRPERRDACLKRLRGWIAANPARLNEVRRESERRRSERIERRLHRRVSVNVRESLRKGRSTKNGTRTAALVGWTVSDLRTHIERQFLPGMAWSNMDRWHIDHIVPLSAFHITGPDCPQLKRAWALTNLRPLWAADNLRKSAKREFLL